MKIIAFTGAGISQSAGIPTFNEMPKLREILSVEYRDKNPNEYNREIIKMKEIVKNKKPTIAHYLLSINNIEVITMNIDELHTKANSKVLEVHGHLPTDEELKNCEPCLMYNRPLLYGEVSLEYAAALNKINELDKDDYLLIIGASDYSGIATDIRELAYFIGVNVVEINKNADKELSEFLKEKGMIYKV